MNWLKIIGPGLAVAVLIGITTSQSIASESLRVGGTGAALGLIRALCAGFAESHEGLVVKVPRSLGSTGGIKALLAGKLDLAVSSRPLRKNERQDGVREILIGRTPLVFVTSRSDLDGNINSADVVAMFGLASRTWPDGMRAYIVVRPKGESDFHLLAKGISGMEAALNRAWAKPGIPLAYTDQDNLDRAESLPGSLAMAALTTVITEKRRVARLALDRVPATLETIGNGTYRLEKPIYLMSAPGRGPVPTDFVAFVQRPQGHAILLASGILPVTP